MPIELVTKFNALSNTPFYNVCFYVISVIVFVASYASQLVNEKPCKNVFGEILRAFHHFVIYFTYYGVLAPVSSLWVMLIILTVALLSWMTTNNSCILTTIENKICKLNKNHIFHDLSYNLSRSVDNFILYNRIKMYSVGYIIILLRLYDFYAFNKYKKIKIHGHRGAAGMFPENTLAAFKYAIENDIDVLEMDLQMTKDKEIIIYHDKNINPDICICNGNECDMNAPIKTLRLTEIKEYDCSSKKNADHATHATQPRVLGEKIPTFIELIHMIQTDYNHKPIEMNIEIKTEPVLDTDEEVYEFASKLIHIIHEYNLSDTVIMQSFDVRALKHVKEIDSTIKTSYLLEDKLPAIDELIKTSKQLHVEIISPDYTLLKRPIVAQLQENGFEVVPWTVNDINELKRMIGYGVNGIITNYPKQMKAYISTL